MLDKAFVLITGSFLQLILCMIAGAIGWHQRA
jgi:hypothetical protein